MGVVLARPIFNAGGGGGGGGAALLATGAIHNLGGSTMSAGTEFDFGFLVKRGDMPASGSIVLKVGGTPITAQQEGESYWDTGANADGSHRKMRIKAILPSSLNAGASAAVEIWSDPAAPTRTAANSISATVALIQATDDYQVRDTFGGADADTGTWIGSRNHALGGTQYNGSTGYGSNPARGWRVLGHGPVCTTIYWFSKLYLSPTTTSYHKQLRAEGIVRYYHASGRLQDAVRCGLPNMFTDQGTHGIATWANKTGFNCEIYRGATKLREWLSTDLQPPVIGKGMGPWLLDSAASWDWSDGVDRQLWFGHDLTYLQTTKAFPRVDFSLTSTTPNVAAYVPAYLGSWPADFHTTGDGTEDGRIGPITWYSLAALKYATTLTARQSERKALFQLCPSYNIDETTGLRPMLGSASWSYGPYGVGKPKIGRTNLWGTTSPVCQLHDTQYGVWTARYQEGVTDPSHWPNFWMYYALNGDERALLTLEDHTLSLLLSMGGFAGHITGGGAFSHNDSTGAAGFHYARLTRTQLRGLGWGIRSLGDAALFMQKFEVDYTTPNYARSHMADHVNEELDMLVAEAAWWTANHPGEFPAVWGHSLGNGSDITGTDSLGRTWQQVDGAFFKYIFAAGLCYVRLRDDIGASQAQNYYPSKLEPWLWHWLQNDTVSCNYYWTSFSASPAYHSSNRANTSTDSNTLKTVFAELNNAGTYSCPANLAESYAGGIANQAQMTLGLASQAGFSGLDYDQDALFDKLQTMRAANMSFKYSYQKAAA